MSLYIVKGLFLLNIIDNFTAEKDNIRYAGITVFSTEDIKERGVKAIMDEAFKIAGYKNNGVHISFDLDVMDPDVAPGVSVPALDGLNEDDAMSINDLAEYAEKVVKEAAG